MPTNDIVAVSSLRHRARRVLWIFTAVAAGLLGGCALPRAAQVPMEALWLPASPNQPGRTLIVFLPGSQEVPQDIVREGFVEQVRARHPTVDVVVADAHVGYFRNRSFEDRLRADVMATARARGYESIWLAGISLGGFGSLMYARSAPGEIEGVIALAPFIASRDVLAEVAQAGGLASWQPTLPLKADDYQRDLLLWLKGYADPAQVRPPLFIGYGTRDRLEPFPELLDKVLPAERLLSAPGGHDWSPWKAMWADALERAPLKP
ncbi:alpha/beta hydrolase-fold protein [Hydrogenophaga sp.]|uniref:alpha/beta hydrolase-fold protein n=1 Tax=Hydrogenophaga sp. TaxID=1904254 RepID=UPI0027266DB0|nr:alpha/beta hydrolase-fold protein [Hydrogenophaga sp.]MDO8905224.1 alpha/beta hydrolase-fold protein [Hydrogenophaga sp.]